MLLYVYSIQEQKLSGGAYMVTQAQVDKLKLEIADLREKKESLEYEYELKNEIQKTNIFANRNGNYGDLTLLPDYKTKWWNSFYVRHRLYAEQMTNFTLNHNRIEKYKLDMSKNPYRDNPESTYSYIQCICYYEYYFCNNGLVRLVLTDPYGTITTMPTNLITPEQAYDFTNRMLYVEIGVLKGSDQYPVRKITPLNYKLYMDL